MKPIVIIAVLVICASLLGVLPFSRHDVGELQPAQTLVVEQPEPGVVVLKSDGELQARGATWQEAVQQLYRQANGVLFLKTAEQIVFIAQAQSLLPQVAQDETLRPAAKAYLASGDVDPEQVTAYLKTRKGGVTLGRIRTAELEQMEYQVPRLYVQEEGLFLYE